mgnify:CR=1 FL=1
MHTTMRATQPRTAAHAPDLRTTKPHDQQGKRVCSLLLRTSEGQ